MEILLFGITRELVGQNTLTVPPEENLQTVAQLREWLHAHFPAMQKLSSLAIAVDSEYADDAQEIKPNQEIALIPPVSGG
ncbi:molybdopterin converting factor subunit 1 [Nibribacter koreensis]|uniref:Molybdopterin synthase sulfur carrier subunit n=1 Tax=Nibribacter koreensis TaxID=1084519 RepID=A0ABP8F5J4_9BACT